MHLLRLFHQQALPPPATQTLLTDTHFESYNHNNHVESRPASGHQYANKWILRFFPQIWGRTSGTRQLVRPSNSLITFAIIQPRCTHACYTASISSRHYPVIPVKLASAFAISATGNFGSLGVVLVAYQQLSETTQAHTISVHNEYPGLAQYSEYLPLDLQSGVAPLGSCPGQFCSTADPCLLRCFPVGWGPNWPKLCQI